MAAWGLHVQLVRTLLDLGANVNAPIGSSRKDTALTLTLHCPRTSRPSADKEESRYQVARLLIEKGANVNSADALGRSPLSHAAESSTLNTFKLLLESGADPGIADNKGKTVTQYIAERANATEFLEILEHAAVPADIDQADGDGYTPFLRAVRNDDINLARYLLTRGANPLARTTDGRTALQLAAPYGPLEMLRLLLTTSIDVNHSTSQDDSALLQVSHRHTDRAFPLLILLEAGANPNVTSLRGWPRGTPLHVVCRMGSSALPGNEGEDDGLLSIEALIKHGADVNATYSDERMALEDNVTPIGLAASYASAKIRDRAIQLLLEAGARPDGLDDRGLPAFQPS